VAYDIPAIRFNYAGTRAVMRVRPLDVKGLVNETYELLEDGKLDRLGRGKEWSSQRGSRRMTWLGPSREH